MSAGARRFWCLVVSVLGLLAALELLARIEPDSLAAVAHTSVDRTGALHAVASGAVTSGLGYVLWYAALPSFKAASAAVIQLSVPAIAALGGVILLAEPLSNRLMIASATILGGIALTILRPRT